MFRVHEIRSTSAQSLAGSASTKRWPNMRIQGLRIAKITAKHLPAVQVIAEPHAWVPWMLRGATQIALLVKNSSSWSKWKYYLVQVPIYSVATRIGFVNVRTVTAQEVVKGQPRVFLHVLNFVLKLLFQLSLCLRFEIEGIVWFWSLSLITQFDYSVWLLSLITQFDYSVSLLSFITQFHYSVWSWWLNFISMTRLLDLNLSILFSFDCLYTTSMIAYDTSFCTSVFLNGVIHSTKILRCVLFSWKEGRVKTPPGIRHMETFEF